MLMVTTNDIAGARIAGVLGQAFGVVVRSRGLGGNLIAGLRSIVGGEIHEYTQMLEEARRHAIDRLAENAALMGANAVVGMRFDSSEIGETMSEIVAYGTAVVIEFASAATASPPQAASTAVPPAGAGGAFGHRTNAP
jgi:uncharacterized protein YbjQ (UPF0145 family)